MLLSGCFGALQAWAWWGDPWTWPPSHTPRRHPMCCKHLPLWSAALERQAPAVPACCCPAPQRPWSSGRLRPRQRRSSTWLAWRPSRAFLRLQSHVPTPKVSTSPTKANLKAGVNRKKQVSGDTYDPSMTNSSSNLCKRCLRFKLLLEEPGKTCSRDQFHPVSPISARKSL